MIVAPHRQELSASWDTGAELLSAFQAAPARFLLPAGNELAGPPEVGANAWLRLRLCDRDLEVRLRGTVVERLEQGTGARWVIAPDPMHLRRVELLLAVARGERVPLPRRRSTRIPISFPVTVVGPGAARHPARTVDVSAEGLRVETGAALAVGSELLVRGWSPRWGLWWPIRLRCRITSSEPTGAGGYFTGLAIAFVSAGQKATWVRLHRKAAAAVSRR